MLIDLVMMFFPIYNIEPLKDSMQRAVVFLSFSGTLWIVSINAAFSIVLVWELEIERNIVIWLANTAVCSLRRPK